MKWADEWGNIQVRKVQRPEMISFFNNGNAIDGHDHLRQFELALEKQWITVNPFFRVCATFIGFNVIDAFRVSSYHRKISSSMTVKEFAGILSHQLLHYFDDDEGENDNDVNSRMTIGGQETETCVSSITRSTADSEILSVVEDDNGNTHELVKLDYAVNKNGKRYTKGRACQMCLFKSRGRKLTGAYCLTCNSCFCFSFSKINPHGRHCFAEHITDINDVKKRGDTLQHNLKKRQKRMLRRIG